MNANLKINRKSIVTINGNMITGDTYQVKDYIKSYLGGKWNADAKGWIVDVEKVEKLISAKAIVITDEQPATERKATSHNGLCPRCHTYCYGDCTA